MLKFPKSPASNFPLSRRDPESGYDHLRFMNREGVTLLDEIDWPEGDGAALSERGRNGGGTLRRLFQRAVGKLGAMSPSPRYGGEILQAMTNKPRIGTQLRNLPCVLHARGADEVVIRFHLDNIGAVLALLKPYRRRHLSATQKAAAVERLRAVREGRKATAQSDYSALGATNAGR
jgi:hypothetical protein